MISSLYAVFMAIGQPYRYKRSSRCWVNAFFFITGAILLTLGVADLLFGWIGAGRDSLLFMFGAGGIWCFGGAAGLLVKREWEIEIDKHRLAWKDGKRSGDIPMEKIRRVWVGDGDYAWMIVETTDSTQHKIPSECYGDPSELRTWLRNNFGGTIEVLDY